MTILGELSISDGDRKVHGKVGYASQQAWIFNGTVKENILFGQDYDKDRYLEVLDGCALQKVGNHHFQRCVIFLCSVLSLMVSMQVKLTTYCADYENMC